ncbi:hypothetical protein [Ulvibacter litoralis]|uniref:Ferredoxin subunit of nitrite reductase or a ring-hydroxylating dioxygenase n=1 Tax=Ulvibacter litoralis TaxID=227084 RepID=A0A1G7CTC2_9FLAO|nr:hypothetical protein [Ulvibacter litoralis]GHC46151.1 hypothetical protein GCM10008083_06420 [Ulvibacter litoralis]SDE42539.1 hypothetical protein SAMN05421855_101554 [Ulvibacter litoralis]
MKRIIFSLFLSLTLLSCNKDDSPNDNNPFLLSPIVSVNLNLNLPQYNDLKFPGNSIVLPGEGIRGIVVYCVNSEFYTAFDLSDPNHVPSSCSGMTISGIETTCPCTSDSNKYDIVTGQHRSNPDLYPMQQYRSIRTGDNIQITN